MRIELAQLPCLEWQPEKNLARALDAIQHCTPSTDLIVFPETFLTGFPTRENLAALSQPLDGPAIKTLAAAAQTRGVSIAIGFSESLGERYFNTTVLLTPQGLAMAYRKVHMWASDQGIFSPGQRIECCEWQGLKVGALICYDIEFPESARALASLGAELLIVTDGNMDPYGPVHRRAIVARAMENQMFAVLVNRCGAGEGMQFPGESVVVDPYGEVVAECGADAQQLVVDLDLEALARCRAAYDYRKERRIALNGSMEQGAAGHRSFVLPEPAYDK